MSRCPNRWKALPFGPRCCLKRGHDGPCLYKCCAADCPGYPYPASERAHPCGNGKETTDN